MTTVESAITTIDELADGAGAARHPLMSAWADGTLTRDDLRVFATQYYQQLAAFPRMLSMAHAHSLDLEIRRSLLRVLESVEGGSPTLSELWLQTCAYLGLFSDTVRASSGSAATRACLGDFFYLCSSSTPSALAALYTCLQQQPALCRMQREALMRHYGMDSGPGLQYFEVREYIGDSHARTIRDALMRSIRSADDEREAQAAAEASVAAMRGMYDGIFAARA